MLTNKKPRGETRQARGLTARLLPSISIGILSLSAKRVKPEKNGGSEK